MPHDSKIVDTETHFIINPETRAITTDSEGNNILAQYDHNSERFTFDIPRYVDGHDMSEVSEVRIHFRNAATSNILIYNGTYKPDDMAIGGENEDIITFSWLLSSETTQYVGSLLFSIQFVCLNDKGAVTYAWNTGVYKDIAVIETMNNMDNADALNLAVWG